jgi:hypothetical protein
MSPAFQSPLAVPPAAATAAPAVTDALRVDLAADLSGTTCVVEPGEAKLGHSRKVMRKA